MPSLNINKNLLLNRVGKHYSDEELNNKLPYIGTTLEKEIYGEDEFEIETYVNRPDMLSEQGLGRALSAFMDVKTGLYIPKINKSTYKATQEKNTEKVRPHAAITIVKGLKFNEAQFLSLIQLQEKLHITHGRDRAKVSIGVYDAKAITFPVTYKAVDSKFKFIPLEETKPMTIKQILEKHPKGKAYAQQCPGPKYVVWEDSKKQVLSFPPIINSAETSVTEQTTDVVVDVTGFDKQAVEKALNIICYHLADMGGQIHEVELNGKKYPDLTPDEMTLDRNYCNKLLGLNLNAKDMAHQLEKMGHGTSVKGKEINVQIPAYRTDILHALDLVEEVAIGYGYDNFEPEIPQISTIGEEDPQKTYINKIKNICTGMQLLECQTVHLSNENDLVKKMNQTKTKLVKTTNAINTNYDTVRNTITAMLIKTLSENTHYKYPQNLFEIGEVYETPLEEKQNLGIVLCDATTDYTNIKSKTEAILTNMKINYKIKTKKDPRFIDGRSAAITVNGKEIGIMGEIHPQVLENFGIEMPVAALELEIPFTQ